MIYCRCAEVLHIQVSFSRSFSESLDKNKEKWMEGISPPWLDSFSWELLVTPRTKWPYTMALIVCLIGQWQILGWCYCLRWIPSCTHPCTFSSVTSPSVSSAIPLQCTPRWSWTYLPRTNQSPSMAVLCNSWSSVRLQILCLLLAVMAYDRYIAISNPLLYTVKMSGKVCSLLMAGVYMVSYGCFDKCNINFLLMFLWVKWN